MLNKLVTVHSLFIFTAMVTNVSMADITVKANDKGSQAFVIQVKGNYGKMITSGDDDYLVYNTATGVAAHVDPSRGTYMEMDKEQINKQIDQAAAMRKQMAPQIKMMKENLDPAMLKMLEERMGVGMSGMMDGADGPAKALPKPKLIKQGNKKIAGLECEDNKVLADGKHIADVCLMKSASGKISKQDFATLEAIMKFFREMAGKMNGMMDSGDSQRALAVANMGGVPISIEDKQGGDSYQVESVSDEKLPDNIFTDYKKLKKTQMPSFMQ